MEDIKSVLLAVACGVFSNLIYDAISGIIGKTRPPKRGKHFRG